MPVYVDRDNKPVTAEEWRELYRDPAYSPVLARHKGAGWEVEASWVGWCGAAEKPSLPFVVRTLSETKTAGVKEAIKDFPDVWCATPEESRGKASEIVLQLCRRDESFSL